MRACAHPRSWEDIELIYAGQRMADAMPLRDYHVPPARPRAPRCQSPALRMTPAGGAQGCKCMIAIDRRLLESGKPDPDSAYWN